MTTFASATTAGRDRGAEARRLGNRDVITLHTGMGAKAYVDQSKLVNRRSLSCMRGVTGYQWVIGHRFPVILADLGENGGGETHNPLNTLADRTDIPTMPRLCAVTGRFGAPPGAGSRPWGPNPPPKPQKHHVFPATYPARRLKSGLCGRFAARAAAWSAAQGHALRGAA